MFYHLGLEARTRSDNTFTDLKEALKTAMYCVETWRCPVRVYFMNAEKESELVCLVHIDRKVQIKRPEHFKKG